MNEQKKEYTKQISTNIFLWIIFFCFIDHDISGFAIFKGILSGFLISLIGVIIDITIERNKRRNR